MDARRRINDDRRRAFGNGGRLIAFVCECADSSCHTGVLLTTEQYNAQRPRLILHPTHAAATLPPALENSPFEISSPPLDVAPTTELGHHASELGPAATDEPAAPA